MKNLCIWVSLLYVCAFYSACTPSTESNPKANTSIDSSLAPIDTVPSVHFTAEELQELETTLLNRLDTIFDISHRASIFEEASNIVYKGRDKSRKWKDTLNPDNRGEIRTAEKVFLQIKVLLSDCDSYSLEQFFHDQESEGHWYVLKMNFLMQDGSKEQHSFGFLKIGDAYCLGDIE